ncbi:MAG TPA: IS110 family transposase [Bacillota bacterium]|nr:IS110 family transposase [Bacillota bacterium]
MNEQIKPVERVIGLDAHPDSFTTAIVRGPTPAAAIVEKTCNKVPLKQLESWAKKNTTEADLFLLEASGNSFHLVRLLQGIGRPAKVLESCQLGKLKEAHANNDKISATRIAKAYLAGTAKEVWVPDTKTQERRDLFHAHRKAVKRTTQARNSLLSYLSDHGVRLKKGTRLAQDPKALEQLRQAHDWSARQWQVIEGLQLQLRHAEEQRAHWRSLIAQEVLADADLLALVRLCGVREMVAFALGAFIGDIKRFGRAKQLVKYVGLNPAFDDSGKSEWSGGIGGHGCKHLRCLLMEGAQAILRCGQTPLAKWGRKLLAAKGAKNLVAAAVARKLTIAVWYLLMGRWQPLAEAEKPLRLKVGKILTQVGPSALAKLGKKREAYRQEVFDRLKQGKTYVLDPNKKFAATA